MRLLITILLLSLALVAAGCGGDDEIPDSAKIPADDAKALTQQLDQIADQVDKGNCGSASFQVKQLGEKVAALPRDVDADLRQTLDDGVAKLESAIENDCQEPEQTTTEETAPTTTEEETQPTTTEQTTTEETTTEETTTEQTTTEQQPPTTETTPPGDGGQEPPPGAGGAPAPGDQG